MNYQEFLQISSQGFSHILLTKELLADNETPLTVYQKLANNKNSFLLESVHGGEKWSRFSIIGLSANTKLVINGNNLQVITNSKVEEEYTGSDPLEFVDQYKNRFNVYVPKEMPRFVGGLVGYFSYDLARLWEKRIQDFNKQDPIGTPDSILLLCEQMVIFDNLSGTLKIAVLAQASEYGFLEATNIISSLQKKLLDPIKVVNFNIHKNIKLPNNYSLSTSKDDFINAVNKIKLYIEQGDCMQVVISERFTVEFQHDALLLYRALRVINPSPYLYYFNFDEFFVVGSSPEVLLRLEEQVLTVRPIAGTRKRGSTDAEDDCLTHELCNNEKELAEHIMLIDLGRNDVGKISRPGSVKVTEKMIIEKYINVMHLVSNVEGFIMDDKNAIHAMRAIMPAGTLSGAPKIRAMEIIDEIETIKRGIYGGAIGYYSFNGNMDTAIAIRTAIIKDNSLYVQAGAGIVHDSVPELEWEEILNKRMAIFTAIAMVEDNYT